MKRKDLIRQLESNDCLFLREGGGHSVYKNIQNGKMTTVPRHREIKENLTKRFATILE